VKLSAFKGTKVLKPESLHFSYNMSYNEPLFLHLMCITCFDIDYFDRVCEMY
jgi:hypothetical protein